MSSVPTHTTSSADTSMVRTPRISGGRDGEPLRCLELRELGLPIGDQKPPVLNYRRKSGERSVIDESREGLRW